MFFGVAIPVMPYPTNARAVLFTGPNQVAVDEVQVPAPGTGEVLIEVHYSCISPGTDLRTLAGKQSGALPWPFVPGYSQVGTIVAKGDDVSLPVGTRVFSSGTKRCSVGLTWGAHISHAVAPESTVFAIPDGVDWVEASLAKLAAIAYHGSRRSKVKSGESVAVVGLGPIGTLSALFHRLGGGRVTAYDLSAERVSLARNLGLEAWVPEGSLEDDYRKRHGGGPDIVVDSTGVASVLHGCLEMAKEPPWSDHDMESTRLLLQGSYPGEFAIDYETAFRREIRMVLTRDQTPADLRFVLQALKDRRIALRDIVSRVVPAASAPELFAELQVNKGALLTAALQWS